jgi:pimeloyl-ACP methyl ester carboxylesterase
MAVMPRAGALLAASVLLCVPQIPAHAAEPDRITPIDPSPLATTMQLVERQFSPLEAFQIQRKLRTLGLVDAIDVGDLSTERFLVRVPAKPGFDGRYGLLVFIDPRKQARFDFQWNNALDEHGVILVAADNAGDDTSALERRIPLALHAYEYARRTYNLDPDRIYVAGAEGGSRLAQRLAFAYPDVFTGMVVNSGAVELGAQALPAPAPESLQRLRTHSRLVFATGAWDQPAFSEQQRALKSLRDYCVPVAHVFDLTEKGQMTTGQGHAALSGRLLANVLREWETPPGEDEHPSPGCEEALQRTATVELGRIRQLDAGGDHAGALKALATFDHAYGRLLFDEEVALAKQLNPEFFDEPTTPAAGSPGQEAH